MLIIVDTAIWIKAGRKSQSEKLITKGVGLIDAATVVVSESWNAKIWTIDKKLLSILTQNQIYHP